MSKTDAIQPAFKENNVAVYLTSSDLYAPYVGVFIQSLVDNAKKSNNYDILVLETDICDENKSLLLEIVHPHENVSLRFVDISYIVDKFEFKVSGHHSKYNFYRLTAPEVLSNYDKIIYVDSDLVVNCDIADLYNISLGDNLVAATKCIGMIAGYIRNPQRKEYVDNVLKLSDPLGYFNSGVMLLNLPKISEKFSSEYLFEMASSDEWMFCDQCVLNVLFNGRVNYIPLQWNVLSHTSNFENEKYLPEALFCEYIQARRNPYISHFAGNNLPIKNPNIDMKEFFWRYAEKTPFYGIILDRMKVNLGDAFYENFIKEQSPHNNCDKEKIKKEISVLVSHRIDINSEIIASPIFQHVRCGAIYDRSDSKLLGDDTGDNISERRNSFCELTVQYWAWKNVDAEYYGLCQYRRYLSFNKNIGSETLFGVVNQPCISKEIVKKMGLANSAALNKKIKKFDLIIPKAFDAAKCPNPPLPHDTVYDMWMKQRTLVEKSAVDLVIEMVKEMFPQYYSAMMDYLRSNQYHGYNCYIMKRNLFQLLCEFQFGVLFELEKRLDMSQYTGNMKRTPGYMGELLYGVFCHWILTQNKYKTLTLPLVFFNTTQKMNSPNKLTAKITNNNAVGMRERLKKLLLRVYPSYRVSIRNEKTLNYVAQTVNKLSVNKSRGQAGDIKSLTTNPDLKLMCFATEIHETHKASFSEFRGCHTDNDVVIVATGPSMKYYTPIPGVTYIGVNKAFKNEKVHLDYYFTTDYEHKDEYFSDLKDYDCIKFFGQYSTGIFRDRFQVTEQLVMENNARKFFQGAPSEDIHINIEYYPLMGFYSIVFQALHFAIYTNAKRIFLVGCDCSTEGYFDGTKQISDVSQAAGIPMWKKGYTKFKDFVERFYPETELISVNPVGLTGMFHDVYTESYLQAHPEINREECEILNVSDYEEN